MIERELLSQVVSRLDGARSALEHLQETRHLGDLTEPAKLGSARPILWIRDKVSVARLSIRDWHLVLQAQRPTGPDRPPQDAFGQLTIPLPHGIQITIFEDGSTDEREGKKP